MIGSQGLLWTVDSVLKIHPTSQDHGTAVPGQGNAAPPSCDRTREEEEERLQDRPLGTRWVLRPIHQEGPC